MNRIQIKTLGIFLLVANFSVLIAEDLQYVHVRRAGLRKEPRVLSQVVKKVGYGDAVVVLKTDDAWHLTRHEKSKKEGYLPESALRARSIQPVKERAAADYSEESIDEDLSVGAQREMERAYKRGNPGARFDLVNSMEKRNVSTNQLKQFAKQGKLNR